MNLIIKNMELPKNCDDCRLRIFKFFDGMVCQLIDENVTNQEFAYKRHPNCPLAEIPMSHGRLIDANKLLESFRDAIDEDGHFVNFFSLVDEAPTIIELEE